MNAWILARIFMVVGIALLALASLFLALKGAKRRANRLEQMEKRANQAQDRMNSAIADAIERERDSGKK